MSAKFNDRFIGDLERKLADNLEKAAIYLKGKVKENLNTTGGPYLDSEGPAGRHYRNEEVSAPGDFPHKMLGNLQRSIAHAMSADRKTAYVGSNLDYALFLEVGTIKMAPRPFFRPTLAVEGDTIKKIIASGLAK
jgi:HK97 gp10 family phage protein